MLDTNLINLNQKRKKEDVAAQQSLADERKEKNRRFAK